MQVKNVIFIAIFTAAICFLLGFVVAANLGDRVLQHERGRADEYLNALNRSQELIDGIKDEFDNQAKELRQAIDEASELRSEREKLRKEIFGIGEQIGELGKIESGDYQRISKLEAIMDRIVKLIRGLQEKSGGQN